MYYENLLANHAELSYIYSIWDIISTAMCFMLIVVVLIRLMLLVITDGDRDIPPNMERIYKLVHTLIVLFVILTALCFVERAEQETRVSIAYHNILKYTMETSLNINDELSILEVNEYNLQAVESNNKIADLKYQKDNKKFMHFIIPDEIKDVEYIKLLGED